MINYNPQFLVSGDIHLRLDNPECRTDDYVAVMKSKFLWLNDLQHKYDCPIFDAGDLLNGWKVSPELEAWVMEFMPDDFYTIAGNHDLKNKSVDFFNKSSLNVLYKADKINLLDIRPTVYGAAKVFGYYWNFDFEKHSLPELSSFDYNIAVIHEMVYNDVVIYEDGKPIGSSVKRIFKRFKGFNMIISGHNHQSFAVKNEEGRWLINPGSMGRMKSNQMDHKPAVYAVNVDKCAVWPIYYPCKSSDHVITRKHIEDKEKKDERYKAFIEKLDDKYEIGSSFKDNANNYFAVNSEDPEVKDEVMDCIYEEE